MKILIVEDDYIQRNTIRSKISGRFPKVQIKEYSTEEEFRSSLNDIKNDPPNVIVMDIMLRWTDPSPNMKQAPPQVKSEGFYRAGFRCQKLLRDYEETQNIPVILYTVLTEEDLQSELEKRDDKVVHITKVNTSLLLKALESYI